MTFKCNWFEILWFCGPVRLKCKLLFDYSLRDCVDPDPHPKYKKKLSFNPSNDLTIQYKIFNTSLNGQVFYVTVVLAGTLQMHSQPLLSPWPDW